MLLTSYNEREDCPRVSVLNWIASLGIKPKIQIKKIAFSIYITHAKLLELLIRYHSTAHNFSLYKLKFVYIISHIAYLINDKRYFL